MKIKIFLSILLVSVFSCQQGYTVRNDSADNFIYQQIFKSLQTEYFRGCETRSNFEETIADKSARERGLRTQKIFAKLLKIDSSLAIFQGKILEIKRKMFLNKTILKQLAKQEKEYEGIRPMDIDLETRKVYFPSHLDKQLKDVKTEILRYRRNLIQAVATYNYQNEYFFSFQDPFIVEFKSDELLHKQIEVALQKSKVNQDDKEVIRKIYCEITKTALNFPTEFETPLKLLSTLCALERELMASRADAFSLIYMRIATCGNTIFDRIIPVIDCPSVAKVGDTIQVSAFMGAYSSYIQPTVSINGITVQNVYEGIAKHTIVVKQNKDLVLKGNISIFNKSGISKTLPWEKRIRIID